MNDSFRTDVFVRYNPETIACACIWLAARQLQVPLPNSPPWYELFDVMEEDVREICLTILRLYARKKPNPDVLEKKVNTVRSLQLEAKKKAKGLFSERDTPNSTSRQSSPKNISPNPTTLIGELKKRIKKEKEEKVESDRSKKRRNGETKSRSRSRSRSSHSHSSRSFSPAPKKRKRRSPSDTRKSKKDRLTPDRHASKDIHKSRKRKHRSHSRSYSYSPSPDYKSSHKKRSKDKDREYKDRDYKENREKYYSPDRHSRKHRNGHHVSPTRDRVDKYDKYDKYRR